MCPSLGCELWGCVKDHSEQTRAWRAWSPSESHTLATAGGDGSVALLWLAFKT
jgi:hypothetical protein